MTTDDTRPPPAATAARGALRFVAAVLLALVSACAPVVPSSPDATISEADRACEDDAQCVVVLAGCCPCSSDGAQTSINGAAEAAVLEARAATASCLCRDRISQDETCSATETACVESRCELVR